MRPKRKNRDVESRQRRGFANTLADSIHRAGEPSRPKYRADTFALVGTGRKSLRLENLYAEFRLESPRGRQELLRNCVRCWFRMEQAVPANFAEARPDLLPVIRRRGTHECDLLEQHGGGGMALPGRVFAGDLVAGVVYDWPESLVYASHEQLTSWGVGLDEVLEAAVSNLRAISGEGFDRVAPGFWASRWQDSHDSARILLPEIVERCEVRGSLVAMVPSRGAMVVTGSEDEDGLERMATIAEAAYEGPRFLSGVPLRLEPDGFRPLEVPEAHPLSRRYQSLLHLTWASDYHRQGQLLTARNAGGVELFSASAFIHRDEGWATSALWTEGVTTLLPKAQLLILQSFDPERSQMTLHAAGEWDRVRAVVGDLLEPLGLYPDRYRVRSFPNPDQLEAIRSEGQEVLAMLRRRMRA